MTKGLLGEFVESVVESALKEVLSKTTGKKTARGRKRQARSPTTGRFVKKASTPRKPAKKQVSRRRTAAKRSRQRSL